MKKFDLLKVLGITFLIVLLLSWIIPAGAYSSGAYTAVGSTVTIGLYDLLRTPAITIATFIQYGLLFLAIGGFYGVLNKTGVYSKLVDKVVKKWNKKEKRFLIITTVLFVLLSSIIGLPNVIFILVPFFITILLKLGYNKMTSFAATVGAILVGQVACTFGFTVWGFLAMAFELKMTTIILVRAILLVMVTLLFVLLVSKTEKTNKKEIKKDVKESKNKKEVKDTKEEVKEDLVIPLYHTNNSKKGFIPVVIVGIIALVLLFVGLYNWYYAFNIEFFANLNESITTYQIGSYPLFAKLLGTTTEIGFWGNYDIVVILTLSSLLLGWIYSLKLNDIIEGYKDGAKEMLVPALYAMLACIIFATFLNMTTGNFVSTIVNKFISGKETFSLFGTIGSALVTSFAYNDFYTMMSNYYTVFGAYDAANLPIIAFVFQAMYGLVMLIAPVSIFLLAGLSYMKISYKDWMKYIWKFFLVLFAITVVVALILTFI